MRFIVVLGVEGSGHHMIRSCLADFLDSRTVVNKHMLRRLYYHTWIPAAEVRRMPGYRKDLKGYRKYIRAFIGASHALVRGNTGKFLEFPKFDPFEEYLQSLHFTELGTEIDHRIIQKLVELAEETGKAFFWEDESYPFARDRNTLRRPDPHFLINLFGNHIEFRFLVLTRHPHSCVASCLRREFSNDHIEQSRIIEDNYVYLNGFLNTLQPDSFRILSFENFLSNPTSYLTELAEFTGIPSSEVAKMPEALIAPKSSRVKSESAWHLDFINNRQRYQMLNHFFNPENYFGKNPPDYFA